MQKRCSIDEEKGNILIMDGGKKKVLCEDTFRTAGVGQKVTSGFGSAMRECLKGKIDETGMQTRVSVRFQTIRLGALFACIKKGSKEKLHQVALGMLLYGKSESSWSAPHLKAQ